MEQGLDRKTTAAFVAAAVIGGSNFIAVSFSNGELPPLWGAAMRFALASMLFFLLAKVRRVALVRGRAAVSAATYGLLGFGTAYAFLYYALTELTAGTASVILASVPIITLVIAVLVGQERFTLRGLAGGLLAVTGIVVLSLERLGGTLEMKYVVAAILGAVSASGSSVLAKSMKDIHPINMNAFGMAAGAALLLAGSLLFGEKPTLPSASATWLAFAWLITFGSVGLFQAFLYVIKRWTASASVYALTAMPLVAVVLGALLLDQPVTAPVVGGGALVIAAVYVGAVGGRRAPPRPLPECPDAEAVDVVEDVAS